MAEGTAICPRCDFIIDSSFISSMEPDEPDDATPSAPPEFVKPVSKPPSAPRGATGSRQAISKPGVSTARPGMSGSRPAIAKPTTSPPRPRGDIDRVTVDDSEDTTDGGYEAPPAAKDGRTEIKSREEIEAARRARGSGSRPSVRMRHAEPPTAHEPAYRKTSDLNPLTGESAPIGRTRSGINIVDPEDVFADAKSFVQGLPRSDKIAIIGSGLVMLFCFLPWKFTAERGEILGLMSLGAFAFIAGLLNIFSITVRVQRSAPRLHPLMPWLLQLGTACFLVIWCLVYMKISWDTTPMKALDGPFVIENSKPMFGVVFALIASLVCLGGTLLGLKEKP